MAQWDSGGPVVVLFGFLASMLVFSQAATLVRFATASPLAICFWRQAIAAALLAIWCGLSGSARRLRELSFTENASWLAAGICLFVHFTSFFHSVQHTSVAAATMLFAINPVTTAAGAFLFFRERMSGRLALACGLGIAGVVSLFAGSSGTGDLIGEWSGLVSAVAFSAYVLCGKKARARLPNSVFACLVYTITALLAALAMAVTDLPFFAYSATTWSAFVAMAIFPTLLGHAVFTYCLPYLNVNFMSCMTLTEPILAALAARWLFDEQLGPGAQLGFALSAASVLVLFVRRPN